MQLKANDTTAGAEDGTEYVPDFRGNRDEPPEAQGYVVILPMTAREFRRADGAIRLKMSGKEDALSAFDRKAWALKERTLKERIVEVHNIWADAKTPIKTGAELWEFCLDSDAALIELLDDIYEAIRSRSKLEEGLRKNSNSPRGSLSVATGG